MFEEVHFDAVQISFLPFHPRKLVDGDKVKANPSRNHDNDSKL